MKKLIIVCDFDRVKLAGIIFCRIHPFMLLLQPQLIPNLTSLLSQVKNKKEEMISELKKEANHVFR